MSVAPIWWIVLVLVLLIFGVPLLLALRDTIIQDLSSGLSDVSPGIRSVALLAMVLITVVAITKLLSKRGGKE